MKCFRFEKLKKQKYYFKVHIIAKMLICNSLCNKNSFRLHLDNEIETLQLSLRD